MVHKYLHMWSNWLNCQWEVRLSVRFTALKGTSLMSHKILNIHLNIPTKVLTTYFYLKLSTVTGKLECNIHFPVADPHRQNSDHLPHPAQFSSFLCGFSQIWPNDRFMPPRGILDPPLLPFPKMVRCRIIWDVGFNLVHFLQLPRQRTLVSHLY